MPLNSMYFKLFGAPHVERDGIPLHGKATQRRRLAILILLAGAPSKALSRDRLVGLVWPERDAAQARKLLSEALYVIRRELGEWVVDGSAGDVVSLSADVRCDLWEFEEAREQGHMERVAKLSDAPFLDGFFLDDAAEFSHWVDGERRTIAAARETALLALISSAVDGGRFLDAARSWERLLHDDPYSSRAVLGAAQALAKGGEGPAALQLLATFEDRLQREMEVAPEPEVLAFAQSLRSGRPTSAATRESHGVKRRSTPVASVVPVQLPAAILPLSAPVPPVRRRRWWPIVAAALLVLASAGVWWENRPEAATLDPRRLAVLYFRDDSAEGDLASVADILTESMIAQLAGSPAFEVIPVSGVRQVRDGTIGLDSIARRFRVGTIIDGSVHRRDESLVVRVRMIDAASGAVVTSKTAERGLYDLFALEEALASELANDIRQRVGEEVRLTQLRRESSNVRAWQLVARANRERESATRVGRRGDAVTDGTALRMLATADSLYSQAGIEDANWVRPFVERGWTALDRSHLQDGDERTQALTVGLRIIDSVPSAQRGTPLVLEVRSALRWALLKEQRHPFEPQTIASIVDELEGAVADDPERARAWATLSNIALFRGEVERASATGRRALEADAYIEEAPAIYLGLFAAALYRTPIDSARAWCDRGRLEYADDWSFHECQLTLMKYDAEAAPDPARAWRIVALLDSLDPPERAAAAGHRYAPIYRRMVAAAVSARAGDKARAQAELARQRAAVASDSLLALDLIPDEITLLLEFGDRAQAEQRLQWAIARRPLLAGLVARDPILRVLRATVAPSADSNKVVRLPPM